jgi:hypothetical protein
VTRIKEVIAMTGRSITAIVLGGVAALIGAVLVLSGMGPMGEYRDVDGYYMSDALTVDRPTHAIVSDDVDLLRGRYETLIENSMLAFADAPDDVRVQGMASPPNALFLGIAPTSAVEDYLSGVAHDEITDWDTNLAALTDIEYRTNVGTAPPGPPGTETFWATSGEGTEMQTLDWTIESGDWTVVIMNADAAAGVAAELAFGAAPESDINDIARTMMMVGSVALIGGGLLVYAGMSSRRR